MLFLHQTGSVKIGEVVRYTVTYTPANDRILPPPSHLYLRIKNTSTVALRAAFIHGPYTLYVSSAPTNFHPNEKSENPRRDGVPEFEPNLKAGGTWYSKLSVPEEVRQTAGSAHARDDGLQKSMSWVIEVASQIIFSNSASVHYEILLGRDEKSLSLGFMGGSGSHAIPGQVKDYQQSQGAKDGSHAAQPRGVYSKAIRLKVEDTASLWNKPKLPEWDDAGQEAAKEHTADAPTENAESQGPDIHAGKRQKKVHLVVLTHGLHSNLGADMLYMKESIDEATIKAKEDARERRRKRAEVAREDSKHPAEHKEARTDLDEDDEEVIVRGFSGNAVRTEKGIKYLGKRLAKYVLAMTYPDQPFKPVSKSAGQALSAVLKHEKDEHGLPIHANSSIREEPNPGIRHAYRITSISFIAHSLGGLIQTYAVAYIHKHSPQFFDTIKPINFVAMATPFLGLSNENPLYVKFALDFGLVGRTGQDLGLTWRAPTIARGGWSALVGGIGESAHKKMDTNHHDPGAKPLLRILPTGPAHIALKKFRNRTVYSNVVNDGIVPLRTSCLLFLDWSGIGRVEKARRENGLIGTVAGWGWAELTGANASHNRRSWQDGGDSGSEDTGANTPTRQGNGNDVPQPSENAVDDDARSIRSLGKGPTTPGSMLGDEDVVLSSTSPTAGTVHNGGPLDSLFGLFRSNPAPKSHNHSPKHNKIYKRSQTLRLHVDDNKDEQKKDAAATTGEPPEEGGLLSAPPKTTFFESAGDLIAPPMPPVEFLIDPAARGRTIFHDRVYHPDDIPPPPLKRRSTTLFGGGRKSSSSHTLASPVSKTSSTSASITMTGDDDAPDVVDGSAMKVEEKIARAYHRDLSWRKVLVRLEPDAHNNMIVRRRFANAYGWPVVKHLVDTHFSDSDAANTRDEDEGTQERAKEEHENPSSEGDEVKGKERGQHRVGANRPDNDHEVKHEKTQGRSASEVRESADSVPALNSMRPGNLSRVLDAAKSTGSGNRPAYKERQDSAQWSDGDFDDSDEDSIPDHIDHTVTTPKEEKSKGGGWNWTEAIAGKGASASPKGTSKKDVDDFLAYGRAGAESQNHLDGGRVSGSIGLRQQEQAQTGIEVVNQLAGIRKSDSTSGPVEDTID